MSNVRHIPKDSRPQDGGESSLTPELREAIRAFMRQEWRRLRRDELFMLRRGMKSELEAIDQELGFAPE